MDVDEIVGGGGGGGGGRQFRPVHGVFVVVGALHGSPIVTQLPVLGQSCSPGLMVFARLYALSYVSISVGQSVVLPKLHT